MPKLTLRDGLMLLVGGLVIGAVTLLVLDYRIVRARAYNGQLAYEHLVRMEQARAKTPVQAPASALAPTLTPAP